MTSITDLQSFAETTRRALEPGLAHTDDGLAISAGSCLYASVLLAETLGRFSMASVVIRGGSGHHRQGAQDSEGQWHGHYWIEAVTPQGEHFVIDITADQFGHEPVRVLPYGRARGYNPGDQAEVDTAVRDVRKDLGLA